VTGEHHPLEDDAGQVSPREDWQGGNVLERDDLMRQHIYEITFAGRAGPVLAAVFDDCHIVRDPNTTILRAELPDPPALSQLLSRITGLGLEVIRIDLMRVVETAF
jgi:hypothetical protein